MITHCADDQLADHINNAETRDRFSKWWTEFDARLATGAPVTETEVTAMIADLALRCDLPGDVARGLFRRELDPVGYQRYGERIAQ